MWYHDDPMIPGLDIRYDKAAYVSKIRTVLDMGVSDNAAPLLRKYVSEPEN